LVVGVGLYMTTSADASLLGFLSSEGEVQGVSTDVEVQNVQTLTILQGARNIDPNPSKGGGDVLVADNSALVADIAPFNVTSKEQNAPPATDQISLYLVQEGDTLSQVAQMFNVSVNTVVWANELTSSKDIHPGQTLLILPISGVQHVVKKGDTVKSLAKKYGGDVDEIFAFNSLEPDTSLVVGSTVTIPGGEIEEEKKPVNASYTKVVSSNPSISGYFIHPLPGAVRTQGIHGYNAVDFGADSGTPVRAAAGGKVIVSRVGGWNGGYGNYIVIEHSNGTQTLYSHNSKNTVWQGQTVVQGQIIGYVGSTGRSTGNHLHFEVRGAKNPF
jgi:LysM repeat protein